MGVCCYPGGEAGLVCSPRRAAQALANQGARASGRYGIDGAAEPARAARLASGPGRKPVAGPQRTNPCDPSAQSRSRALALAGKRRVASNIGEERHRRLVGCLRRETLASLPANVGAAPDVERAARHGAIGAGCQGPTGRPKRTTCGPCVGTKYGTKIWSQIWGHILAPYLEPGCGHEFATAFRRPTGIR